MNKPKLRFWQIWNMSFGFLGIQFGFGLQNANVSRIFQTLGADIERIPLLWIAAPVTGLIMQPIIGYLSDHTWGRFGRRRPFFMIGAILASLALLIMPNSPALWIAAGMLWIMDASINISMEPFRAFVGDMLPDDQRTLGFTMQSFFIGIGAFVASWLPYILANWLNIPNTAEHGLPPTVIYSFYFGGAVFLCAVMWTVFTTKEYSPEEMKKFETQQDKEIREDKTTEPEASISGGGSSGLLPVLSLHIRYIIINLKKSCIFSQVGWLCLVCCSSSVHGSFVTIMGSLDWSMSLPICTGCLKPWHSWLWSSFFPGLPSFQCGYTPHPPLQVTFTEPQILLRQPIMRVQIGLAECSDGIIFLLPFLALPYCHGWPALRAARLPI